MNINFDNDKPIYLQIMEYIEKSIISSKYEAGKKIPSVRELSSILKVNPNTVQKSLSELEELGLIYTERTNGKYVTKDKDLIIKYKKMYADNLTDKYIVDMLEIGYSKEDINNMIGGMK